MSAPKLTEAQRLALLRIDGDPADLVTGTGKALVRKGFARRTVDAFAGGRVYVITDAGRAALRGGK